MKDNFSILRNGGHAYSQLANACVTVTVSMFSHASQNHRQCPTPYFLSQASFMVRHSLASLSLAAHCPRA